MSALLALLGAARLGPIELSATWADISFTAPTFQGANANVTLTFPGGAREIQLTYGEVGIEYRINSGSYTSYGAPFSVESGDTLNFQATSLANFSGDVDIFDVTTDRAVDTFAVNVDGY